MESSVGSPVDQGLVFVAACQLLELRVRLFTGVNDGVFCRIACGFAVPRVVIHEQLHPQREQELVAVGAVPRSQVTARAVVVQDLDKRRRDARIRGI